jgi:hypothetical protein
MTDVTHKTPAAANAQRGELDFLVDGVRYVLRWNISALCAAETQTGRTFAALLSGSTLGSVSDRIALLWAALQPYHGDEITTLAHAAALLERAAGALLIDGLALLKSTIKQLQEINQPPPALVKEAGGDRADPPSAQVGIGIDSSSKPDAPA